MNELVRYNVHCLNAFQKNRYKPILDLTKEILRSFVNLENKLKNTPLLKLVNNSKAILTDIYYIESQISEIFKDTQEDYSPETFSIENLDYHDWDGGIKLIKKMEFYKHIAIISEENT